VDVAPTVNAGDYALLVGSFDEQFVEQDVVAQEFLVDRHELSWFEVRPLS
jgi:hypothetical protein